MARLRIYQDRGFMLLDLLLKADSIDDLLLFSRKTYVFSLNYFIDLRLRINYGILTFPGEVI